MSRKAKNSCPGCKRNKLDHDFGKPSAKCTGPTPDYDILDEDPETLELSREIRESTLNRNLLLRRKKQQLLAANEALATELEVQPVVTGREDIQSSPTTMHADTPNPPPRTTIKNLRKNLDLVKAADDSIKDWLQDSDSCDDEAIIIGVKVRPNPPNPRIQNQAQSALAKMTSEHQSNGHIWPF